MSNTPEAIELRNLFRTELDPQSLGFIAKATFRDYINKQPNPLQYYQIQQIFRYLTDENKMNEEEFVIFMLAYSKGMHQIAMARFSIGKELKKYAQSASNAGPSQIFDNYIKLQVLGKDKSSDQHQKNLSIAFGKDNNEQSKRREEYEKVLGRQISEISIVFKFNAAQNLQKICECLTNVFAQARQIASEMLDPQMSSIIQLIQITVKQSNSCIYIFFQLPIAFLNQTAKFLSELIQSINPAAFFVLKFQIHSSQLQKFFDSPGNFNVPEKFKDLSINISAKFDSFSKLKLNQMLNNVNINKENYFQKMIFMLFQEVQLQSKFINTESLFKQLGIKNQVLGDFKQNLQNVKQLELIQTISGFIPSFGGLLQAIKQSGNKSDQDSLDQISLNFGCLSLRLEFNLNLAGLLNLL